MSFERELWSVEARYEQLLRLMDGWPPRRGHQVKGGLLLDVVVSEAAAIVQLLAGKDKALLVTGGMPSLSLILALTLSMVSELSTPE